MHKTTTFTQRCLNALGITTISNTLFALQHLFFSWPEKHASNQLSKPLFKLLNQGYTNLKLAQDTQQPNAPHWLTQQLTPSSPTYSISPPTHGITNTTQRNWTALSLPLQPENAIIDPNGLITPLKQGWSIEPWLHRPTPAPLSDYTIPKQYIDPTTHIITTEYDLKNLTITSKAGFTTLKPNLNALAIDYTLHNTGTTELNTTFSLSLQPYNPEGYSAVTHVDYHTDDAFILDYQCALSCHQKPSNILCLNQKDLNTQGALSDWEMILKTQCQNHQAQAYAQYDITLAPGKSITLTFSSPTTPKLWTSCIQKIASATKATQLRDQIQALNECTLSTIHTQLETRWTAFTQHQFTLKGPSPLSSHLTINTSHILNALHKNHIKKGPFTFNITTPQTIYYTLKALHRTNHHTIAKTIIEALPKRPKPSEASILLLSIADHIHFTQDKDWLKTQLPKLKNAIKSLKKHHTTWIKTTTPSIRHSVNKSSLLNPFGSKKSYLLDHYRSCAALRKTKALLKWLGLPKLITQTDQLEQQLTKSLQKTLAHIKDTHKTSYIPVSPSHTNNAAILYNLEISTQLNLYPADDMVIQNTLKEAEYYTHNSLVHLPKGQQGISPLLTFHLIQIYNQLGNPKGYETIEKLLTLTNPTGGWPETIHPTTGKGCSGAGLDTATSANFILTIYQLLVKEENSTTLHLTPKIPQSWCTPSTPLVITNLPTSFGLINATYNFQTKGAIITLNNTFKHAPKKLIISLPTPIKSASVDGKACKIESGAIITTSKAKEIKLHYN